MEYFMFKFSVVTKLGGAHQSGEHKIMGMSSIIVLENRKLSIVYKVIQQYG
jgi:hypothetical protein